MFLSLVLIVGIVASVMFILFWLKKFFFVRAERGIAPNTKRALAVVIDGVFIHLVAALIVIMSALFNKEFREEMQIYINYVVDHPTYNFKQAWLKFELGLIPWYLFAAFIFESTPMKATPGAFFMELRVVKKGGEPINILQALLRNLFKGIAILGWPIAILFSWVNINRRWLHDHIAGTKVIDRGMEER